MIILGSDHAGLDLKKKTVEYLKKLGEEELVDVGAFELDANDDFTKYVKLIIKCFDDVSGQAKIMAFCGSGGGMSIGLNRHKKIYCIVGHDVKEVEMARIHDNINAIAFGGRLTTFEEVKCMINTFLNTECPGGRHTRRMEELDKD